MVSYDEILHALGRAGDFTIRMIRGVFAEAAFAADVLPALASNWREADRTSGGDPPYDFLLEDVRRPDAPPMRVQVKMQRSEGKKPLTADQVWSSRVSWPADHFVVEVQRSRKGEKKGKSTRPYRFGEFDILAVSLGPSTGRWKDFVYTVERWLLPDPADNDCILTYQPVSPVRTESWTPSFEEAASWFRGDVKKRIDGAIPKIGKTTRGK